jgi:3-isopropylmalate/(R)-2-methylmalate dehydratase small subunit
MSDSHKVWRFGADIDTDQLAPGAYMKLGIDDIARHCLEAVRPEFAASVRPGDVMAAGPNFGIGSSREQAAAALVTLGVKAVIAPSFSGLFFRNAFNLGLLLLTCREAEQLREGERVALRRCSHCRCAPRTASARLRADSRFPARHGAGRRADEPAACSSSKTRLAGPT